MVRITYKVRGNLVSTLSKKRFSFCSEPREGRGFPTGGGGSKRQGWDGTISQRFRKGHSTKQTVTPLWVRRPVGNVLHRLTRERSREYLPRELQVSTSKSTYYFRFYKFNIRTTVIVVCRL